MCNWCAIVMHWRGSAGSCCVPGTKQTEPEIMLVKLCVNDAKPRSLSQVSMTFSNSVYLQT